MPFEFGMTVAWAEVSQSNHYWIVLESKPYRLHKSLSDLNGYDHFVHNGTVVGVFRALLDAFDKPDVSIAEMKQIYGKTPAIWCGIADHISLGQSLPPSAFRRLAIAAAKIKSGIRNN